MSEPQTNRQEHKTHKRRKFIHALEDLIPTDFTHEEWAKILANMSVKAHGYRTPNLPEP